jgi:hypothetical protein
MVSCGPPQAEDAAQEAKSALNRAENRIESTFDSARNKAANAADSAANKGNRFIDHADLRDGKVTDSGKRWWHFGRLPPAAGETYNSRVRIVYALA